MLRTVFYIIVMIVFILNSNQSVRAGNCLRDFRNISHGGENMRLRDYYCRGDNGAKVRVQFHRVTDYVATAMLDNTLPPNFQPILGGVKPVPNEVYSEFQLLMDSFGGRYARMPCEFYQVIASGSVGEVQNKENCDDDNYKAKIRRTLGGWDTTGGVGIAIPNDMKLFLRNRKPRGYRDLTTQYQRSDGDKSYRRFLRSGDLKDYAQKIRSFNRIMTRSRVKWATDGSLNFTVTPYIKMLSYITRKGIPKKFLTIDVTYSRGGGCDDTSSGWSNFLTERGLLVDFALIENVSGRAIQVSDLHLSRDKSTRLRSVKSTKRLEKAETSSLEHFPISLEPGGKAVLFQRLAFTDTTTYDKKLPTYVYGQQALLRKFKLGDEQYDLQGNSANFISLTGGISEGSCPFLYAWNEGEKAFVNHGKILDKAIGVGLEQSESMSFKGFVSRFRIAEEEAEVAHLDEVYLTIEMKNGKSHRLLAHTEVLQSIDKQRVSLYMGNTLDLTFELPKSLKDKDVIRSTLTTYGYYDRYSAMTTARNDLEATSMCPMPTSNSGKE